MRHYDHRKPAIMGKAARPLTPVTPSRLTPLSSGPTSLLRRIRLDGQQNDVKDILATLVSFASVSEVSNLDIADYIQDYVTALGADCLRFPSPDGNKTNVLARFGPAVEGGVVLSGHMDVVPAEGQVWCSDPFRLSEREGRLYGRGSADMKGFLAACLAASHRAAKGNLRRPLYLAFSYDEEVGCTGVSPMVDYIAHQLPPVDCVIVGEPTQMELVVAHKGANDWRTVITGKEAHSSLSHAGAHAIFAGARLISFLETLQNNYRDPALDPSLFDMPYPTLSVGLASGGTAGNIIPAHFAFEWEVRAIKGGQAEAIYRDFQEYVESSVLPELRSTFPAASIISTPLFYVPPLVTEDNGRAERLLRQLTGQNDRSAVAYCTEAGLFQAAGLSTVLYGPGSIVQAHQPDEFITVEQLEKCVALICRVFDRLSYPMWV
jgi:acetylornithine deacetylase